MKEKRRCSICHEWFETDKDYISCPAHSFGETTTSEDPTPMNQNPNTNKERCNQCKLEGNTGICDRKDCIGSTPSPKDWEYTFDLLLKDYADNVYFAGNPLKTKGTTETKIKDFIRQEKAKSYEEGLKNGKGDLEEMMFG